MDTELSCLLWIVAGRRSRALSFADERESLFFPHPQSGIQLLHKEQSKKGRRKRLISFFQDMKGTRLERGIMISIHTQNKKQHPAWLHLQLETTSIK